MTHYIRMAAGAAVLVAVFSAGWAVQGWRKDGQLERLRAGHQTTLAALSDQARAAEAKARAAEQLYQSKIQEANNAARTREIVLRRDADNARAAAGGLRDEVAALKRRLASASTEASADGAAALGDVLLECTESYRGLAEKADRHASDVRTLIDAWPVYK